MDLEIIANEKIDEDKILKARKIIAALQKDIPHYALKGAGPFVASIYDAQDNLIVKTCNSVLNDKNSNHHAEMNAIKEAEKKYNTHDLSPFNLSLYVTSEPCMMCLGGILWSGIKAIYYGVPSYLVEEITGFDEGFKQNWLEEFKKRGITVYGNIEVEKGVVALENYVKEGKTIYKPLKRF